MPLHLLPPSHPAIRPVVLGSWMCLHLAASADEPPSFRNEVLPILSGHCFECHGFDPGTRFPKDEPLRLDDFASATSTREDGHQAIAPGDPAASRIMHRVRAQDPDLVMPPPAAHKPLSPEQIDTLERWIAAGAKYERHWAFDAPPHTVPVPETQDTTWPRNPIDSFVLARLENENLSPSPPASPERWLRRVTFDITGLPPTQRETDAFLTDASTDARETVVDRLLDSPRFGEHRAAAWLDVARYADSSGYQADVDTHVWPYRDWVIRAFNDNLPLDQFIIHQLAGDLLENPTRDHQLATAFNRVHRKTNEAGSVPEEYRQEGIADRVHTVGTAFMALTMECARCHDHKYDPITAKDYFAMGAFFNSIDEHGMLQGGDVRGNIAAQPALLLPTSEQETRLATLETSISTAATALSDHLATSESTFQNWLASAADFPSPDLVAHLDFEDKSLKNSARENADAKLGGNKLVPGRHGNALLADGDSVTTLPNLGINHADQPFSFSLWLHPAEVHPRAIVFANVTTSGVNHSGYSLVITDGRLHWTLAREFPGCAASIASRETLPIGKWTHVTVTNDGSRQAAGLQMFINGTRADTDVIADTLTNAMPIGNQIGIAARSGDSGLRGGMIDDFHVHLRAITSAEVAAIHSGKPIDPTTDPALLREYHHSAIDPTARKLTAYLTAARTAYLNALRKVHEIPTMRESAHPVPAYILDRGDYTLPTVKVERQTPDWLPPFPEDQPRNRLGFAKWLTSPNHPLTARVTINRLWQELFGHGIVETSDNFGLQGAQPTHPELLDWLARDLIENHWDQKRAIRQIVLSATYAQDSAASPALREHDPHNALLARGPARRLTAEQLRDSALAHSGLLSPTLGGPPAKPYQAPGSMWKTLNNFLPEYQPDKGEGLYRRSLYTFWRRTTTPPNMIAFDAATRDVCATRRQATNTPLQALVLLNDVQFVEAARKLGERILIHGGTTDEARATWAWREAIGTTPTPDRLTLLLDLLREQRALYQATPQNAAALLKTGDSPADPALDPIEAATFTTLAQALLNLDAHITLR